MTFSELSPRQKAAVFLGALYVLLGSAIWLSADGANPPLCSGLIALGVPLLGELAGDRGARARRALSMIVPAGGGAWLGYQVHFLDRAATARFVALVSDTYPLLLLLAAIPFLLPRTRLAAYLLAAGFLCWLLGLLLGFRLGGH